MVRLCAHALVFFAVFNLLDYLLTASNGLRVVLDHVGAFRYGIIAVAVAAGLHQAKAAVVTLVVLLVLSCTPLDIAHLTPLLIPVGAGLVLGTALRAALRPE